MASSSSCQEGPESGTPEEWDMDEWVTVTSNINEKLKTLEKDNDETVQEIEECFGTLTDEVCLPMS